MHFETRRMSPLLTVILVLPAILDFVNAQSSCSDLHSDITSQVNGSTFENATIRIVDHLNQNDSEECLNTGNLDTPPPCATLGYALQIRDNATSTTGLMIHLRTGTYTLKGGAAVLNSQQVAIIGAGVDATEVLCGSVGIGQTNNSCLFENFQVLNSTAVLVANITFTGCGPVTSNIYIASSEYVVFENCVIRDNISPPVLVYNSARVAFLNTTFQNNVLDDLVTDPCYYTPREAIVFFVDNRTSAGGISFFVEDRNTSMVISESRFYNNVARQDSLGFKQRDSRGYGHGGALTVRLVDSSDSLICIDETIFDGNNAQVNGGAIAGSVANNASGNEFIITNSVFVNNSCNDTYSTGGAIGFDVFDGTRFNLIEFNNCNFSMNEADSGGAISLATSASAVADAEGKSNRLTLQNCRFEGNRARYEGTAVSVLSLSHTNEPGIPTDVTDCYFGSNAATVDNDKSAIAVYRVVLTFRGSTTFYKNRGGGVTLLSSRMDLKGDLIFMNNTAAYGAGLSMSGRSYLLLYSGTTMQLLHNAAFARGGGMYIDNLGTVVSPIQVRSCFIQYDEGQDSDTAIGPRVSQWDVNVTFIGNTALYAGAAIYANDMSRCVTFDASIGQYLIFNTSLTGKSPFSFRDNRVLDSAAATTTVNQSLASDAKMLLVRTKYDADDSAVGFGEDVVFLLSARDELDNFRETAWSLNASQVTGTLGAVSTDQTVFTYTVPSLDSLNASVSVEFTLLGSGTQSTQAHVTLSINGCHPGYNIGEMSHLCECSDEVKIVRCDSFNRYFYVREGFWVGVRKDNSVYFATTLPGFLNCTRIGSLPGCLFKYDHPIEQCAAGREDTLCGDCQEGYGVTFDLRFCKDDCGGGGIALFIGICILTFIVSLLVLHFDFPLPNELKGILFFAQVIGLIYRNTPYLQTEISITPGYRVFDFLINMLGFAVPFPVCLWEGLSPVGVAFLGFCPPIIALVTAATYAYCASRVNWLSNRTRYGFHGFYFIALFVYKYLVDTLFIFITCTDVDGEYVFAYQGTVKCMEFPFVLALTASSFLLVVLVVVLPLVILKLVYRPQKSIQVSNSLSYGLKEKRRYLWYGVWEIWRRLPFVAVNLLVAFTTRSIVLFTHCLLIFACLAVLCVVKPYKKAYINVIEASVIMCLFGATLAILDDTDRYIGPVTSIVFSVAPFVMGAFFICFRAAAVVWSKIDKGRSLNMNMNVWITLNKWKRSMYLFFAEQTEQSTHFTSTRLSEHPSSGSGESQRSKEDDTGEKEQARVFQTRYIVPLRESLLDTSVYDSY